MHCLPTGGSSKRRLAQRKLAGQHDGTHAQRGDLIDRLRRGHGHPGADVYRQIGTDRANPPHQPDVLHQHGVGAVLDSRPGAIPIGCRRQQCDGGRDLDRRVGRIDWRDEPAARTAGAGGDLDAAGEGRDTVLLYAATGTSASRKTCFRRQEIDTRQGGNYSHGSRGGQLAQGASRSTLVARLPERGWRGRRLQMHHHTRADS